MSSHFVGEDELQAFADGELSAEACEMVLYHLAASPADQAKVEEWRQQNMRLREAFAAVAHEPVPPYLAAPQSAHILTLPNIGPPYEGSSKRRSARMLLPFALGFGLGSAILLAVLPQAWRSQNLHGTHAAETANFDSAGMAVRIAEAMAAALAGDDHPITTAVATEAQANEARDAITAQLQSPDLTKIGLPLTGAQVMLAGKHAGPLGCFSYSGKSSEHFVLCIAGIARDARLAHLDFHTIAASSAAVIAWQEPGRLYALSGSIDSDHLVEVAHNIRAAVPVEGGHD